jgi:iron complex outermembrane receptor protein
VTDANLTGTEPQGQAILVTGSRIRQDPNNSALPLQVVTTEELSRNGINSPEQLLMYLTTNGSGADNLASNSDVVSGAQRGTNGLSAANLRGQGSSATLVLLNGRRVAAHGLSGSAVDVNQIPFAAIERVEVLKDGASAIYGTDAVGGVINFITRKDYQGLGLQGFTDVTQRGDGNIYRVSGIAGYGDLAEQGFNIMGAVSYSWNQILRGRDRSFVNGNQPNRGLSIDTRGTPIATAFGIGANTQPGSITNLGTLLTGLTLTAPTAPKRRPAASTSWIFRAGPAANRSTAAWPMISSCGTRPPLLCLLLRHGPGRRDPAADPDADLLRRGVVSLGGNHEISLEATGSDATSAKSFSEPQLSANATNLPIAYPLNDLTRGTYNQVFGAIRGAFPNAAQQSALDARYGGRSPIAGVALNAARASMSPTPRRSAPRSALTGRSAAAGITAPAHPMRTANPPPSSAPAIISAARLPTARPIRRRRRRPAPPRASAAWSACSIRA